MLMDCTVKVAGTVFNDGTGRPSSDPSPVVLDGLSVVWGRSTTVDQPEPSTCTFTVADWTGAHESLDALQVGQQVDVDAAGIDYGAPTDGTFDDPSITRLTPLAVNVSAVKMTQLAPGGVAFDGRNLPPGHSAFIGYFRPDDPSSDPSAWVDIPRMQGGQNWTAQFTGTAAYGASVTFQLVPLATPAQSPVGTWWENIGGTYSGAFDVSVPFQIIASHYGNMWAALGVRTSDLLTWATIARTGLTTWDTQPQTWADMARTTVTHVDVLAPLASRSLSVRVFSGRITDVEASYDNDGLTTVVTAADMTAEMANRRVGAEPWPTEAASARIGRILAAAGAPIPVTIDAGLGAYLIARQDVDAQAPTDLLHDVAASVDAVMWAATSELSGPYLTFENVAARPAGRALEMVNGIVEMVTAQDALLLDACAILRDTVTWRQDTADVITRVGTRWLELGTDTDGQPTETERTEWVTDVAAETAYGARAMNVGTQLTTQADAQKIGAATASRVFGFGWRMDGLTVVDTDLADVGTIGNQSPTVVMADLLDGTRRIGRMTAVSNMPAWAPNLATPGLDPILYLEGGLYEYTDQSWLMALVTSDSRGQAPGATWQELDASWRWIDFDPSVTWDGIRGAVVE